MANVKPAKGKSDANGAATAAKSANEWATITLAVINSAGMMMNARFIDRLQAVGWPTLTLVSVAATLLILFVVGHLAKLYGDQKRSLHVILFVTMLILFIAPSLYKEPSDPRYWKGDKWASQPKVTVSNRKFINERVELDGKSFSNCEFSNCTLVFHGRAPFDLINVVIRGMPLYDYGDDPKMEVFLELLRRSGALNTNKIHFFPNP